MSDRPVSAEQVASLHKQVDTIPSGGEWWKRSTGYTFKQAAEKLVSLGMTPDDAVLFLSDLYQATAEEYGG